MKIEDLRSNLPKSACTIIENSISELRPAQEKAVKAGIFEGENLLICTPTASGKTFIAEMAFLNTILKQGKKAIYIVPLKALASEKKRQFSKKYDSLFKTAISIGDMDSDDSYLAVNDLIICTSEKLDS